MRHHYRDILEAARGREPVWWDENGVPRYCEFAPRLNANIYADEVVLVLIQCQECATRYRVCISTSRYERQRDGRMIGRSEPLPSLAERIQNGELHYGDPPNACPGSCAAGATMGSVPVQVLEFWKRPLSGEMERLGELERDVWPDWMPQEARR